MGEFSELVIDGDLCEGCGVYIDNKGINGFPQLCPSCAKDVRKAGGQTREIGNGLFQNITPINRRKP